MKLASDLTLGGWLLLAGSVGVRHAPPYSPAGISVGVAPRAPLNHSIVTSGHGSSGCLVHRDTRVIVTPVGVSFSSSASFPCVHDTEDAMWFPIDDKSVMWNGVNIVTYDLCVELPGALFCYTSAAC